MRDRDLPRFLGLVAVTLLAGVAAAAAVVLLFPSPTVETTVPERIPVPVRARAPADLPRIPVVSVALVPRKALKAVPGGAAVADDAVAAAATVLTSDGWLVADAAAFDAIAEPTALLPGGAAAAPTATLADPATGLVFFRVDAKNLDVVAFGESATLVSGTVLYRTAPGRRLAPVGLLAAHGRAVRDARDVIRASDAVNERLLLGNGQPQTAAGAGLITPGGLLIGVLGGARKESGLVEEAVPIEAVARALRDIVRSGEIHRPSIGASTVDLSELAEREQQLVRGFGALVAAVESAGPASAAGIAVGDRITALGRDALDGSRLLSDLLASYKIGESVSLTYARGGEEKTVTVTVADGAAAKRK